MSDKTQQTRDTSQDPRWAAVLARDPDAEGQFVYSVKTTGVYCRPTCPSRTARPENVTFHATPTHAQLAGFRPCKRCRPDQPTLVQQQQAKIARLCRYIESAAQIPTLAQLSQHAGISRYHLHRLFRQFTGLTPREYAQAHRASRVRETLHAANSVTEALYEAGYGSNSRFYEESNQVLGMTPTEYRAGGAHTQIHFAVGDCSLGAILVAQTERGICAILIGDDPTTLVEDLRQRFSFANLSPGDAAFAHRVAQVVGFVEDPGTGLDLPLDIRGTAFQQRVWQALRDIPAGQTLSYAQVAQCIGSPRSVRAVAGACAANAIAVAIPCHRVVRSDGGLSGYRWGTERKRALLERERKDSSS